MIKILHASKRKKNNNVQTLPGHHVMRNFKNIFMVFHEVLKTKWTLCNLGDWSIKLEKLTEMFLYELNATVSFLYICAVSLN